MNPRRCQFCHHARTDGPAGLENWCGLQRLADPAGTVTALGAWPSAYLFEHGGPRFSVTRVQSPGFVFGWRRDWRTGQARPHHYESCREFTRKGARP